MLSFQGLLAFLHSLYSADSILGRQCTRIKSDFNNANKSFAGLRSGKPILTTPALPQLFYSTHSVLSVYSYCDPTNKIYFWNKNTAKEKVKRQDSTEILGRMKPVTNLTEPSLILRQGCRGEVGGYLFTLKSVSFPHSCRRHPQSF